MHNVPARRGLSGLQQRMANLLGGAVDKGMQGSPLCNESGLTDRPSTNVAASFSAR